MVDGARGPGMSPRRVLPVVAAMLIGSAALRVSAGSAWADEGEAPPEAAAPTAEVLAAFAAREERAAAREADIARRLAEVAAAEAALAAQLAEMRAAEESLEGLLAMADTAAADDLGQLAAVYEAMRPAEAAALFATMEPGFSAGFLGLMRPEAAAAIMTDLDPDVAYAVSAVLAGRNAGVPTE